MSFNKIKQADKDQLILVVDDDKLVRKTLSDFLIKVGYSVVEADDGKVALSIIESENPDLIITDLQMPGLTGSELIKKLREKDITIPVMISTGYPDMESAINAIHDGAIDYFVKPFSLEMLYSRIESAMSQRALIKENLALSELASLHTISNQLSGTRDIREIVRVVLDFCSQELSASTCSIAISNESLNFSAKKSGEKITTIENSSLFTNRQSYVKVIKNPEIILDHISKDGIEYVTATLPIKTGSDIPGAVYLEREVSKKEFSPIELNTLDVLISQAGSAAQNAGLYDSLNQRLSELSLVSNYSEQFLGVIDLKEVIRRLFLTMKSHFSMDFMGFFLKKKRFHEYHYWSSRKIDDSVVNDIVTETVNQYSETTDISIKRKRITPHIMQIAPIDGTLKDYAPKFIHVIPLVWENYNFGALYFSSIEGYSDPDDKRNLLDSLVSQTRIALTNAQLYTQMKENYIRTIKALAIAVDAKDTYTHGHSENVMNIGEAIAREMKLDEETIGLVRDGGLLHDIGKIGIPGYILNKPGPLTDDEYNGVMKTHSTLGANIVRDVPFLKELHTLILHHHEHHDGNGYPDGLKGDEIPIGAQILHVADAFEAMTSDRPYRKSLGKDEAVKRLESESGKQFNPKVIDAFFRLLEQNSEWFAD